MSLISRLFPYPPTHEQGDILDGVAKEQPIIVVDAGAGAGKSSTLLMSVVTRVEQFINDNMAKRILILQFNAKNAEEMRGSITKLFEQNEGLAHYQSKITALTGHSFAMRELRESAPYEFKRLMARFKPFGLSSYDVNAYFKSGGGKLRPLETIRLDKNHSLAPAKSAALLINGFNRFLQSDKEAPHSSMISFEELGFNLNLSKKAEIRRYLNSYLKALVNASLSDNGELTIGYDVLLKKWVQLCLDAEHPMTPPMLDTLMVDEYQDSNLITTQMVQLFHAEGAKIICVGDEHQAIYGFRGASNQMTAPFFENAARYPLTGSFRFCPQIGEIACRVINYFKPVDAEQKPVKGVKQNGYRYPFRRVAIDQADMIICRSNKGVREVVLQLGEKNEVILDDVYIKDKKGLIANIKALVSLRDKGFCSHPEYMAFKNFQELIDFSETDEGKSIKSIVEMISSHDENAFLTMLNRCSDDIHARIKVVTAHASKGLEAEKVILYSDFDIKIKVNKKAEHHENKLSMPEEEANILYVALTRAQDVIDYSRINNLKEEKYFIPNPALQKKMNFKERDGLSHA